MTSIQLKTGIGAVVLVAALIALVVYLTGIGASQPASAGQLAASAAAATEQADQHWADTACSTVLRWKDTLHRDETSTDLSFGPIARLENAAAATVHLVDEVSALGLPPGARTVAAHRDFKALADQLVTSSGGLRSVAGQLESGDVAAALGAISDTANAAALATALVHSLQRFVSVDLGLAMIKSGACRDLALSAVSTASGA